MLKSHVQYNGDKLVPSFLANLNKSAKPLIVIVLRKVINSSSKLLSVIVFFRHPLMSFHYLKQVVLLATVYLHKFVQHIDVLLV